MNYKVGDRVRIVDKWVGTEQNLSGYMDKWLGKVMTIRDIGRNFIGTQYYKMVEDKSEFDGGGWYWFENMIAGLADDTTDNTEVADHKKDTPASTFKIGDKAKVTGTKGLCSEFPVTGLWHGIAVGEIVTIMRIHPKAYDIFECITSRGYSQWVAVTNLAPLAKPYNGKVVCVETSPEYAYTKGKTYEFKDGVLTNDKGKTVPRKKPVTSIDEWNDRLGSFAKFIPAVD